MLADPGPFQASRAGCGATVSTDDGHPRDCWDTPAWAGLRYYPYPRGAAYLAFVCDAHNDQVEAARQLLDRDRLEMARRQAGGVVEPLATGAAARRLVERAVRYYAS